MFGNNFKQRVRLESIAEFILTGCESHGKEHKESMEEQRKRLEIAYMKSLKNMKTRILAEPWDDLDEYQAQIKLEDIIAPVFNIERDIQDLYFQAGLLAGFAIAFQAGSLLFKN